MQSGKGGSPYGLMNPKARHAHETVQQCRNERAQGARLKQISRKHNVPIDTLRGWLYRGVRAYPDHMTKGPNA